MSSLASEQCGVVGVIVPGDRVNTVTSGAVVDMARIRRTLFILQLGTIDCTVDFKLQESATSGGTYSDIPGKAITQLTASDDNKQAVIELEGAELGFGQRHARCVLTSGAGSVCLCSVLALGCEPRFAPVTEDDLATVAQVVS